MTNNENMTNLAALEEMMGGKKDLVKEIIDVFLNQIPGELNILNNAIANVDYPSIKKIAHTMMSTVSIMGISKLAPILFEIESLGLGSTNIERIKELQVEAIRICEK